MERAFWQNEAKFSRLDNDPWKRTEIAWPDLAASPRQGSSSASTACSSVFSFFNGLRASALIATFDVRPFRQTWPPCLRTRCRSGQELIGSKHHLIWSYARKLATLADAIQAESGIAVSRQKSRE